MAAAIEGLLDARELARQLSTNAAADARRRFDVQRQADDYLDWYRQILAARPTACETNS
jgi:glycosyltransferase involved in cell wall biosynthesis